MRVEKMSDRSCIILNPAAKGERARRLSSRLQELMPEVTIKLTKCPGDAEALAERAVQQGYHTVICAGGDGTLNEVVNGLAGSEVVLGVLPVGTMNVFALELGISSKLEEAVRIIRAGRVRKVDLAWANQQCFVQLAGVGLDAQIVSETDVGAKKTFGPLSYVFTLTQVAGRKPPRLRIQRGDRTETTGSFVLVGNGRYYGGPFKFFPHGDIADGKLDVCVFKKMSHIDIFRYLQGILAGTHTTFRDVEYFQTKSLRVDSEDPVPVEVDGELYGHVPVDFSVEPRALRVLVP
jgi:YegS/Rv2252/BmrU family lipid kinase